MDLLEVHRQARARAAVALHRFLIDFGRDPHAIYIFYEGENDASFYAPCIRHVLLVNWPMHTYRCQGKDAVLYMQSKVDSRVGFSHVTLFFIDRDLGKFVSTALPNIPNVYVTDYYSIENHIVEPEVLLNLLTEVFHYELTVVQKDQVVTLLNGARSRFHRRMTAVMAWIVAQLLRGKRVMKNNLRLERLFPFQNIEAIGREIAKRSRPVADVFQSTLEDPAPLPLRDWLATMRTLRSAENPKMYVRGKYETWFFLKAFEAIREYLKRGNLAPKAHVSLTPKNLVEVAGPRCTCPASLRAFLHRNLVISDLKQ